ncbi:MAG TPA: hypothetical protein VIX81_12330 [Gammaproteobacteria bacterium]
MTRSTFASLLFAALLVPSVASAQMSQSAPASAPPQASMAVPGNGLTMDQVVAQFGEPQQKSSPVGDPPITRWAYEGYTVYFEHDKVLHSVIGR